MGINQIPEAEQISRREWIAGLGVAICLTAILAVPYLFGHLLTSPGLEFTGVIMNPEDSQTYFAKILQGFDGRWLYTIPFTPEEHDGAFLGTFYLALGHMARLLSISVTGIWHLARIVCSLVLFIVTFIFISTFVRERRVRWIAYSFALIGSGMGWLLLLLQQPYWLGAFPTDFKMPEAHLFFSALTFPHVALGTALILTSFLCLYYISQGHQRGWLLSGVGGSANLALGIVYPFLIYLVIVTYALQWLWLNYRRRRIDWNLTTKLGISLAFASPLNIYYVYVNQSNEVFRSWSEQAITSSPPWPHFLIAFGPLLFLALLTLFRQPEMEVNKGEHSLLWIWIIAAMLLAFAPINAQRRFIQGVHVPLSILAAVGLVRLMLPRIASTHIFKRITNYPRYTEDGLFRLIITTVIIFLGISNIYLLADVTITAAVRQPYPFFRQVSDFEAIEWLRDNTEKNAVVLAAYETGNLIAARAGNRVFIGHWAETVDWEGKFDKTAQFFDETTSDEWRTELLDSFQVLYLWHSPKEMDLGAFDPAAVPYLEMVFESGDVSLYIVKSNKINS